MKTGVIGDIHQDAAALRATLDGPLRDVGRVVALGDVVDRGPDDAAAVLDLLAARDAVVTLGNHELAYLGGPRFPNMVEDRNLALVGRLRDMVLDGQLVAAVAVGDVLCVHGGVTHEFWRRHLEPTCGTDVHAIAAELSRRLVAGVARRDLRTHPSFAAPRLGGGGRAARGSRPGPYWAHARLDLLDRDALPPFPQVIGHVAFPDGSPFGLPDRQIHPVLWEREPGDVLGHRVVDSGAIGTARRA